MLFIVIAAGGLFLLGLGVGGWRAACWGVRALLGIPRHAPFYAEPMQPLPDYLESRNRRGE